jgi:hypothetical protein
MRWVLWLVETDADAPSRNSDLMEICRPEGLGEVADLGIGVGAPSLRRTAWFCQSSRQRRLNEQYAEQSSDHAITINHAELGARK